MQRFFPIPFLSAVVLVLASSAVAGDNLSRGVNLSNLDAWDIVLSADAAPPVRYAARELQSHVEQAAQRQLPVKTAVDRPDQHIFVGPGSAMRESNVGFETRDFGPEDLRIQIGDANIAIAGGHPRGTLYAVYVFLEDYFGVRFLTADHTHVPAVGAWRVAGPVDRSYHPPFAMRWSYFGEINRDPVFAARMRTNTVTDDARLGGKTGITNINHSFLRQIPSRKYGKAHPEYYCMIDGERRAVVDNDAYDNEPCLTNPDVVRIVTRAVLEELERDPRRENISVSQNDNDKYCRCERCAALDAREASPMGSLLTFVNAVADEVAQEHPEVQVGTLAYWYSRKPPRTIRPRQNVQIQLCSIECCQIHPIDDPSCPENVEFCRDLRAWAGRAHHLSIWNYNTNFSNYLLPCPNWRVLERNARFFAGNGATSIFMQGPGNAWATELSDLRNYVISNLIWDPSRNAQALVSEFLHLHYGPAAPHIQRYVDLIVDAAEASGKHRNCFASRAGQYGLDGSVADEALALFDKALQAAPDEKVRARVEKASIGAYRLAIDPLWSPRDGDAVDPDFLDKRRPILRRFIELCDAYEVDMVSEREPYRRARSRLMALLEPR